MAPPPRKKGKEPAEPSDGPAPPMDGVLQDYIPEPIATIDFSDLPKLTKSYKSCVEKIINEMKGGSGPNFIFFDKKGKEKVRVPVTPAKDNTPSGAYTIALEDGNERVLLVAEKHQNWFRGILTSEGRRYEINGFEPKIMAGSQSLHTSGRYYDLIRKTVAGCKIGYNPLVESFHNLAGHDQTNGPRKYKTSIAVLLVMLFEASRFPAVFKRCLDLLKNMSEGLVGDQLEEFITDWADISFDFYEANAWGRERSPADRADHRGNQESGNKSHDALDMKNGSMRRRKTSPNRWRPDGTLSRETEKAVLVARGKLGHAKGWTQRRRW